MVNPIHYFLVLWITEKHILWLSQDIEKPCKVYSTTYTSIVFSMIVKKNLDVYGFTVIS